MAKKGRCVICGRVGRLTRDHVPPHGCIAVSEIDVRTLAAHVGNDPGEPRHFRDGYKVPSLCERCNNVTLGQQYDPALISFTTAVTLWVRAQEQLVLPRFARFRSRPVRLAKAIVGHLLASEERTNRSAPLRKAPMITTMRDFFLDFEASLPSSLEIYVWPFPSDLIVIARGIGIIQPGGQTIVADVLKFYPLGYLLVFNRPAGFEVGLPRLNIPNDFGPRDEIELVVDFAVNRRRDWPEQPQSDDMILFNDRMTMVAKRRLGQSITASLL